MPLPRKHALLQFSAAAIAVPTNLTFLHPPPWLRLLSMTLEKWLLLLWLSIEHSLWALFLKTYQRSGVNWQNLTIYLSPNFKGERENMHMGCCAFRVGGSSESCGKNHIVMDIAKSSFPPLLLNLWFNISRSYFTLHEAACSLAGALSVLESPIQH